MLVEVKTAQGFLALTCWWFSEYHWKHNINFPQCLKTYSQLEIMLLNKSVSWSCRSCHALGQTSQKAVVNNGRPDTKYAPVWKGNICLFVLILRHQIMPHFSIIRPTVTSLQYSLTLDPLWNAISCFCMDIHYLLWFQHSTNTQSHFICITISDSYLDFTLFALNQQTTIWCSDY